MAYSWDNRVDFIVRYMYGKCCEFLPFAAKSISCNYLLDVLRTFPFNASREKKPIKLGRYPVKVFSNSNNRKKKNTHKSHTKINWANIVYVRYFYFMKWAAGI